MKNNHSGDVITTKECKSSKEPPKDQDRHDPEPLPAGQNVLDARSSLARMREAASHINTQLQDISSFVESAKHRLSELRKTLSVLHRGNEDLHMRIQKLQNSGPAQVQIEEAEEEELQELLVSQVQIEEEEEELKELLVSLCGESPEGEAKKQAAAPTPAAEPRPGPVVIDIAEEQPSLDDVKSPPCVEPVLKARGGWSFRSLTANILQLPKIVKYVVDAIKDDNFALRKQAEDDELVEVVVLP